jgi:hypothetical protein
MTTPRRLGALALGAFLVACGSGSTPNAGTAGHGGSGAGGSTQSAGNGGGAGIGATAGGAGGSTQTAGSGGGAGAGAAGATPDAGGAAGATDGASADTGNFPSGDCAPGAVFCDGFESYILHPSPFDANQKLYDLIPVGETAPVWLGYHFHGPPRVDTSKPFKGKQNLHLDTEAGDLRFADIIKESPDGVELFPAAHYGRVMVWLKVMPTKSGWNIVHESGLVAGSTTEVAQFSLGGANGKLAVTYTEKTRIVKNAVDTVNRRGGGPQNGDPAPHVQCSTNATTEALETGKWVCVEWMLDRTKGEAHMWVNSAPQPEVDAAGKGTSCTVGTPTTSWRGPAQFTELVLGWEAYEKDAPGQEAWFDEFAIGTQKLGCPTP